MGARALAPSEQEWLETDGLGGFASSTTLGINTRRYHGLLFLSGRDPGERYLVVSKLEERCEDGDFRWELSSNVYPGVVYPDGADNILEFRRYPFPCYLYRLGKRRLKKEIFMVSGRRGVYCVYRLEDEAAEGPPLMLRIRPLLNNRFYHHTAREGSWEPRIQPLDGAAMVIGHVCGTLLLSCPSSSFSSEPVWYRNMLYPWERRRGLDYFEDHLSPGEFLVPLRAGEEVVFWAGPVEDETARRKHTSELVQTYREARAGEEERRLALWGDGQGTAGRLALAADQFIVKGPAGASIIAGYHWFGEWGRDAFISLPGVCLKYGRFRDAQEVFLRFAEAMSCGHIPNCFHEATGASYNTVDAALWMVWALAQYEKASGDQGFVDRLVPAVRDIVRHYISGTPHGVKMEPSGLLWAGDSGTQLTWMDACAGGVPVTCREGMPVEVNALWVCTLFALAGWERRLGNSDWERYGALAASAAREFIRLFRWSGVGLYDRIDKIGPICEVRPNQVLAAFVLGTALPQETLRQVFRTATETLVTPRGLRTLAPGSPGYAGSYRGGPEERDRAYHQGAVWPFLSWPYIALSRMAYPEMAEDRFAEVARNCASGFMDLDANLCAGSVFEIASGDPPNTPDGAVAQAWSVSAAVHAAEVAENPNTGHALGS